MGMLIAPDSPIGQELWKWEHHEGEAHPSDPTIRGMRPSSFRAYPAMMYQATQKNPWVFESEEAKDENAQRNMESRGFVSGGKQAAADAYDKGMQDLAVAAAERNAKDQHMSERALMESSNAEQASSKHLGEIPRTPIKKRAGRPKKETVTS